MTNLYQPTAYSTIVMNQAQASHIPIFLLGGIMLVTLLIIAVSIGFVYFGNELLAGMVSGDSYLTGFESESESQVNYSYVMFTHDSDLTASGSTVNVYIEATVSNSETLKASGTITDAPDSIGPYDISYRGFFNQKTVSPYENQGYVILPRSDHINSISVCVRSSDTHINSFNVCETVY